MIGVSDILIHYIFHMFEHNKTISLCVRKETPCTFKISAFVYFIFFCTLHLDGIPIGHSKTLFQTHKK